MVHWYAFNFMFAFHVFSLYFPSSILKKMLSKKILFLLLKQNDFPKSNTWENKEYFLIMISSCLELMLIIITYLSYKLILCNIL